jgi:hypothetical protein
MGLFRKNKHDDDAPVDANVYYSTPFGDTRDGGQKLFLLQRDGVSYFPVFRSLDSMKAFFEQANRAGYVVLQGDVASVSDTMRSIELMKDVRIVIEPLSEHPVEITPA